MGHRLGGPGGPRRGPGRGPRRGITGLTPMGRIFACFIVVAVAMGGGPAVAITSEEFVERADLQRQKGDLRAAIIELKNALQKNRNNAAARVMLGRVYVDAGDGASAEKELSRAETLGVRRADLAKWLGEAWLLQRKYQKVLDDLAIAGRAPRAERAALLYLRGEARRNLKDAAGAEADFRAALSHDPKSGERLCRARSPGLRCRETRRCGNRPCQGRGGGAGQLPGAPSQGRFKVPAR